MCSGCAFCVDRMFSCALDARFASTECSVVLWMRHLSRQNANCCPTFTFGDGDDDGDDDDGDDDGDDESHDGDGDGDCDDGDDAGDYEGDDDGEG